MKERNFFEVAGMVFFMLAVFVIGYWLVIGVLDSPQVYKNPMGEVVEVVVIENGHEVSYPPGFEKNLNGYETVWVSPDYQPPKPGPVAGE